LCFAKKKKKKKKKKLAFRAPKEKTRPNFNEKPQKWNWFVLRLGVCRSVH